MDNLEQVAAEIRRCGLCRLSQGRKLAVPGEGPPNADLMLVGEGPGFHENEQGRPFVGAAGMLLQELLAGIGLRRTDVFITNVVKCRPPNNRDPLPDELAACHGYLERQIALLQPKVICTLGRFSMAKFFPPGSMRELHGKTRRHGRAICLALYHPAAALRQAALKQVLEQDFRQIPVLLEQARAEWAATEAEPPATGPRPEQLSLF